MGGPGVALVVPSPVTAQLNLGTQRVVDLNRRNIVLGLGLIWVDIVLDQPGRLRSLRLRDQGLNVQSDLIQLGDRNRVVCERIPDQVAVDQSLRGRIVNRVLNDRPAQHIRSQNLVAGRRRGCAKIAGPIGSRGNGDQVAGVGGGGGTGLVVEKEKGLISALVDLGNPDGSAGGAAEVVYSTFVAGVGVRAVGVEGFVGPVIVCGSMELVGARSHGVA